MIAGPCCHCWHVDVMTTCPFVCGDEKQHHINSFLVDKDYIAGPGSLYSALIKIVAEDVERAVSHIGATQLLSVSVNVLPGCDPLNWERSEKRRGRERDANVHLVFLVTCKLVWPSQPFAFA